MTPEAIEALSQIFESQKSEIRVSLLARITRIHSTPNTPTVDCQPVVSESIESLEGVRDFETLPELLEVPVMFPQGASGFFITFPLEVGGIVEVTIGGQDFSEWFSTGQDSHATDARPHALNNAKAHPCGFSRGHGPPLVAGCMVLGGAEFRFGLTSAALHLAVAELVNSELSRICSGFDGHTHTAPPGGGPTSTPVAAATPTVLSPANDVKSVRLKVDS